MVRNRTNNAVLLCVFFNDTATTEIYPLSLHDALPIFMRAGIEALNDGSVVLPPPEFVRQQPSDRKSGSAGMPRPISYAVFWLTKRKGLLHHLPAKQYTDGPKDPWHALTCTP